MNSIEDYAIEDSKTFKFYGTTESGISVTAYVVCLENKWNVVCDRGFLDPIIFSRLSKEEAIYSAKRLIEKTKDRLSYLERYRQ